MTNTDREDIHRKRKNIHSSDLRKEQKSCGYGGKLHSQQIFPDFYHIACPHSYQQITVCAIFQKKIFNLIKGRKIVTFLLTQLPDCLQKGLGADSQGICFAGGIDVGKDYLIGQSQGLGKI